MRATGQRPLAVIYLAINAACAAVVFQAAHRVTAQMAIEQRTLSDSVDGITFFAAAAPAFLVALLTNAAWVVKALVDLWRRRGHEGILWIGGGVVIWGASILAARLDPG